MRPLVDAATRAPAEIRIITLHLKHRRAPFSARLSRPPGRRATVSAPRTSRSHSSASAPSPSYRRSPASLGHRTESIAGRSLSGASPRRRAQSQPTSPARCGEHRGRGRRRAWSTWRIPGLTGGLAALIGHVSMLQLFGRPDPTYHTSSAWMLGRGLKHDCLGLRRQESGQGGNG